MHNRKFLILILIGYSIEFLTYSQSILNTNRNKSPTYGDFSTFITPNINIYDPPTKKGLCVPELQPSHTLNSPSVNPHQKSFVLYSSSPISPFENNQVSSTTSTPQSLTLNKENIEKVLEDVRPYLIADGGDCSVHSVDNNVVYLKLEGACSNCPSSVVTVKMGIEKILKEYFPMMSHVEPISDIPETKGLTTEAVEEVLNSVRPFLSITGSSIEITKLSVPTEGIASTLELKMKTKLSSGVSQTIRLEIIQRIKKAFPTLSEVKINQE